MYMDAEARKAELMKENKLNVLGGARLMNLKNEPHLGYSTRH